MISLSLIIKFPPFFQAFVSPVQQFQRACTQLPTPYMRVLPDNMARKRHHKTPSLLITTLLCMFFHLTLVSSDALALLNFKASLRNDTALASWRKGPTPPCKANKANWVGIHCWQGKVRGLKLENMGLHGAVDVDSLLSLSSLRSISVMNNKLSGPLPEVRKLGALKSVYLSNNNFSGLVESDSFTGMAWLKKLHLANNHLTGNIPSSLTSLPKLLELRLEGNQFVGRIPDFQQKSFRSFNVSNNYLSGSIPPNLSRINASSFSGESLFFIPMRLHLYILARRNFTYPLNELCQMLTLNYQTLQCGYSIFQPLLILLDLLFGGCQINEQNT